MYQLYGYEKKIHYMSSTRRKAEKQYKEWLHNGVQQTMTIVNYLKSELPCFCEKIGLLN